MFYNLEEQLNNLNEKDIELIIKIPEKTYKHIMSMQFYIPGSRGGKSLLEEIIRAIRTGTPKICSVDLVGGESQESEEV